MLLAEVVEAAATVAGTPSRLAKVGTLSALLRRLADEPDQAPIATGLLLGKPRQGRTGIGWRTLSAVTPPAAEAATLTLPDVDDALQALKSVESGAGVGARRGELLGELFGRATGAEQDFLRRALLGDMRTGALDGVLLDAVAGAAELPAARVRRAAMLIGDLGLTAQRAVSGDDLGAVGLTPGVPVLPMLAASAPTVTAALAELGGPASVEYKMDGARLQVHRVGGEVTAYTRSLADITPRVPELAEMVAGFPGGDLILDGETLTLDADGKARPFADSMSRFGATAVRPAELSAWFFDVLHADGVDYLDEPLERRRIALQRIVGDRMMPGEVTASPAEAERVFADAVAAGHEGAVVKDLSAPYAAGRRGKSWIKVKPVHTYDLVVLAAEWGYGRRQGWLSNLHLGARDPDGQFGPPGGFVMVGKTFKGLTDAVLEWQTEYFPTIQTRSTTTTVFVQPTTVVEIAIDGVQRSTRYPGGVALRFARVKRYRSDAFEPGSGKPADQADTIEALRALLPIAD
ncbi:ATP-dependent DNA ligase [Nakamurella aerolata]|uniref:DNA ligase (ATP) n=1 Tax=Nakamurella aerolata TaxID=1656892 RepID=A0A849AF29_9ACTN|nr:ATP-dependent DNA ligase [Nakamurella aerolata]NNG35452.1 ATP-dependent DNA ligase [Nakamurella aerolata]